jgi:LmbE family N-acetylglucosaminyl deacetylase
MITFEQPIHILAPHADDELIGCFSLLQVALAHVEVVYYATSDAMSEAKASSDTYGFDVRHIEQFSFPDFGKGVLYLAPDPYYELHPEHRRFGNIGMELLRKGGQVMFYVTNMQAPYICEQPLFDVKRNMLNRLYPGKSDLWALDHKYFLFEGYCQWKSLEICHV